MTITYQAGDRLQGLSTDTFPTSIPSGSKLIVTDKAQRLNFDGSNYNIAGWKEVGRAKLGTSNATISVANLPDKRYYVTLTHITGTSIATAAVGNRFNSDSGSNYAGRRSINGASDTTQVSDSNSNETSGGVGTTPAFGVSHVSNFATKEKLLISHYNAQSTAGAATAPNRWETVGKWANTTDAVNEIIKTSTSSPTYNADSEVVVLAYDPADVTTPNFWEELDSVSNTTTQDTNTTGTFTAKKYLWVQMFVKVTGATNTNFFFNGSKTGGDYSFRESENGGTDSTGVTQNTVTTGTVSVNRFINMFIVNDGTNEPLVIYQHVDGSTAGAGTAPNRKEVVFKSDVVTQLTTIGLDNSGGGSYTAFESKVWGSD